MNVVIRADAANHIGTGHIMRCLTLAHSLANNGATVEFICREFEGNIIEGIISQGFNTHRLPRLECSNFELDLGDHPPHANWLGTSWQNDVYQSLSACARASYDWLVIDHYAIESQWQQEMRALFKHILVIDDLADRRHECDILLDQNVAISSDHNYEVLVPDTARILLGPEYCLLRPEFHQQYPELQSRETQRVLVFFGGIDRYGYTFQVLKALVEYDDIHITIVTGSNNLQNVEIEQLCKEKSHTYLSNISNMAEVMASQDYAVIASGFVCYEVASLQIPSLFVPLSDIQDRVARKLASMGIGSVLLPSELNAATIRYKLEGLRSIKKDAFKAFCVDGTINVVNSMFET
jgi:UDP-2,4-diacetamido-2,4,6-trideoxy-beta-L-altropyranose hydrolase